MRCWLMEIILQYVNVSNPHTVHLKCTVIYQWYQWYLNKARKKLSSQEKTNKQVQVWEKKKQKKKSSEEEPAVLESK